MVLLARHVEASRAVSHAAPEEHGRGELGACSRTLAGSGVCAPRSGSRAFRALWLRLCSTRVVSANSLNAYFSIRF